MYTDADDSNKKHWDLRIINLRKYSFATFLRDLDFAAPALR